MLLRIINNFKLKKMGSQNLCSEFDSFLPQIQLTVLLRNTKERANSFNDTPS